MNSFYSKDEIKKIGFRDFGKNVFISRKASIYSPEKISIGNNVRIDDFCILSGEICIGNHVHISPGVYLYGGNDGIFLDDFSGISAKSIIYSITDDFSGEYMVGSMINDELRNVISGKVMIEKYVQIGAGNIVLPNITLKEGATTGANTFVNKDLNQWKIYVGSPARVLKERKRNILKLKRKIK